jgi:hypothetical protein
MDDPRCGPNDFAEYLRLSPGMVGVPMEVLRQADEMLEAACVACGMSCDLDDIDSQDICGCGECRINLRPYLTVTGPAMDGRRCDG